MYENSSSGYISSISQRWRETDGLTVQELLCLFFSGLRPRFHEQIKHTLFAQIRPELLHTDREFEQLKEVLFAHVNAALRCMDVCSGKKCIKGPRNIV